MTDPAFTIGEAGIPYLTIPGPADECTFVAVSGFAKGCEQQAVVFTCDAFAGETEAYPACQKHWFEMQEKHGWILTTRLGSVETHKRISEAWKRSLYPVRVG